MSLASPPFVSFLADRLAAAPPRTRTLLGAGAGAAALLLATASDPVLAAAGRGTLIALALGALAWWARRRPLDLRSPPLIDVAERVALSRDASVALLRVRGRALLVGYGPDGVRLLADVGPAEDGSAP